MTNSKILLLGVLLSAGTFVVVAQGCGDDTSETTGTTTGTGNTGNTSSSTTSASGGGGSSSSANGGGGAGQGGGGAGSGGGAAQTCAAYCADNAANCTGELDQWGGTIMPDGTQCEKTCATWDVGMASDTMGNTLGCHIYHSGAAKAAPMDHCIHSGPSGADQCGAPCDNFCELAAKACTGMDFPFTDDADCKAACAAWAKDPTYSATTVSGDSYACRLYHATAAAADKSHCPHIADVSPVCKK